MRDRRLLAKLSCTVLLLLLTSQILQAQLFKSAQTFRSAGSGAAGQAGIAAADVNGDGKIDVVVANLCVNPNDCHGEIGVILGNGDGTFQPAKGITSSLPFAIAIAVADLNHDHKPDLVASIGGSCSPTPCPSMASVMMGNGDGTFTIAQLYPSGGLQANSVVIRDLNGDGRPDLLVAHQCADSDCHDGLVGVLLGNGDGTFQTATTFRVSGGQANSMAVGDVNGDGKLDAVIQFGVLLGNGNGTFQPIKTFDPGGITNAITVADVNGDGKLDVLVVYPCVALTCGSALGVFLGNGNGTFQAAHSYAAGGSGADSIATADINGDGKLDALVPHKCGGSGVCDNSPITVLTGKGDGSFKSVGKVGSGGRNAYSIAVADVNGDSKFDLLIANACQNASDCSSGNVGVLLGLSGVQTKTILSSNLNPSIYGKAVTLTAEVTSIGQTPPTGTVRFLNGTTGIGIATLGSGGVATLTTTHLPAATLSLTATYNGDSNSAKSTSAALSETVTRATTTTTITSSSNPSALGQAVTFIAKVTSPTAQVTGTVTFKAGSIVLGVITISGGKASITTSALPKGTSHITAAYTGTANITGSSVSLTQVVN